jgi:hypothetical protein
LNTSLWAPAPGAPRPRPASTATASACRSATAATLARRGGRNRRRRRQGGHAFGFRFPAEQQLHLPVRIELDHHARQSIDDPDVVLRVDTDLLRHLKSVRILADLANELAGPIELEQPRPAVRKRPRRTERHRRMSGARVDKHVALGIRRHAGGLAEVDVCRELQRIRRIERDFRHGELRRERYADDQRGRDRRSRQQLVLVSHDRSSGLYFATLVTATFAACGLSISFCTRQDSISATRI